MRSAALSIDITPPVGLPIGGNVRADNISRGVHDNLLCNIILLEEDTEKVCFLSLDLLGLHYDSCRLIKYRINSKTGLKQENIIINCIHTHSGPDVLDFFKEEISKECLNYISDISEKISAGVRQAVYMLQEVKVRISKSSVYDLSFNRRLVMKDGSLSMNWEYPDEKDVAGTAGPVDHDLFVIALTDPDDSIKALIVNFTLHPAILVGQDWLWSRDYVNYLDNYIKRALGENVTVLFANGAEGNINHIDFRDKNQDRGFIEAERIGNRLGKYVLDSLAEATLAESTCLACVSSEIELPYRKISREEINDAVELWENCGGVIPALVDGCPDEIYAAQIIKMSKRDKSGVTTEIMAVRLSEDIIITTLPGEVFTEFGIEIKETSGYKNTLVFGLANDCIGYIPTNVAFEEGGYEIKTATSSQLDPVAGSMLVNEIQKLVKRL